MKNTNSILDTNIAGSTPEQNTTSSGIADVFNAFMVQGAEFCGKYGIPKIPDSVKTAPASLVPYPAMLKEKPSNGSGAFAHFYVFDQMFDGPYGIWSGCRPSSYENKKGFRISRFDGYDGLIAPDFSLYGDMPLAMQIWNVYRSRAFGYWMTTQGKEVIPNVRWTDEKSFEFCFDGIPTNSVVAVGTLGCANSIAERNGFALGFYEMIRRIKPRMIIIYGTIFPEIEIILVKSATPYRVFSPNRRKRGDDDNGKEE